MLCPGGDDCLGEIGYDSEHGPRDQDVSVVNIVFDDFLDSIVIVTTMMMMIQEVDFLVAAAVAARY